jgi:hypothetical protein
MQHVSRWTVKNNESRMLAYILSGNCLLPLSASARSLVRRDAGNTRPNNEVVTIARVVCQSTIASFVQTPTHIPGGGGTLLYPPGPAPGGPGGGGGGAELSSGGGGGGAPAPFVGDPACAIWLW